MISTVAVGTDGSPTAAEAVRVATELAQRFEAELVLLSASQESKASRRGQIDEEKVQIAPVDVGQHLGQRPVQNGTSPGHYLVATRLEHAN